MDEVELRKRLKRLIEEYVDDKELATNLIDSLDNPKAKYVLAEIELNKHKEYSSKDREIIEEIAFYYC
ncbi:hypothetical protein [Pontibacillus sp. HMF3514]|uniref:hypothetical protein n=1 Tax=Pontibacillus sp. HMF3514 TaxID=2692425 RepID=UPI00131F75F2|nr:hypothetical protein [Pontibacillus sp. HMF3514]QHE54030.1 hypothetical protein GS400_19260 [Pontibacillus sp. HMF3514]